MASAPPTWLGLTPLAMAFPTLRPISITTASVAKKSLGQSWSSGHRQISFHHHLDHCKVLAWCTFSPSTNTPNSARIICGQPFVARFVTFSKHSNLWSDIRSKTVGLLDLKQIKFTSIDLVRFCWEEQAEDYRSRTITSPITIWVGVQPGSTNGDAAFDSAQDILKLLKGYDIDDIDIAYRESEVRLLALYAPVM